MIVCMFVRISSRIFSIFYVISDSILLFSLLRSDTCIDKLLSIKYNNNSNRSFFSDQRIQEIVHTDSLKDNTGENAEDQLTIYICVFNIEHKNVIINVSCGDLILLSRYKITGC